MTHGHNAPTENARFVAFIALLQAGTPYFTAWAVAKADANETKGIQQ